ncbi:MAG: DUF4258 domain-containing protein [Chloroflexi bacterium]|nr:DUF4258 domain-containing protein [Chloroflexota bacterium]
MLDLVFTDHAKGVLTERNILADWVWQTLAAPSQRQIGNDGNIHYLKPIENYDNRVLRVVVNERVRPNRIITVFFDRRMRGKL